MTRALVLHVRTSHIHTSAFNANTPIYSHLNTSSYTHTLIPYANTYICTNMRTHTHATHAHTFKYIRTCIRTQTHIHTYTIIYVCTNTYIGTLDDTYMYIHTLYTLALEHTNTQLTNTHVRTYMQT